MELKVKEPEEINASKLNIYKAIDKNQVVMATSNSMNALASKLDISLAGLKYHLGRESYVYTKYLKCTVKIVKEGVISFGQTKDFYKSKKVARDNLELNNISISSLEKGYIFIFNEDKKTIFDKGKSSPSVFKLINPDLASDLDTISLKRKADNMSTYINKEMLYSSELGKFYLAKNPDYAVNAKMATIVIDVILNTATYFNSKRECARYLSKLLNKNIQLSTLASNKWIDSGKLVEDRVILVSSQHFYSLIPDARSDSQLKEGTVSIIKYNINFIDKIYTD